MMGKDNQKSFETEKKWKVAVIGCGMFADFQYFPYISKEANAVCVAACDIVPEHAIKACKKFGIPEYYTSVYDLIEKCDFDIAIDSASIQAHHEINMAILNAGKHLISQKPAAPNIDMLTEQIELAKKKGVGFVCAPVHPMRYDLAIAKQMIKDGAIGNPTYIKCNSSHGGPEYFQYRDADPSWFYEKGAGAMVDMGVHGLQIVTTMFGPVKCFSCLGTVTTPERTVRSGSFNGKKIKSDQIPDQYLISLRFANGKIGFVDTGFSQKATKAPSLEIFGDAGTIAFTRYFMTNPIPEIYVDSPAIGVRGWMTPDTWESVPPKMISQCCLLKDLIRSIETGEKPLTNPEHARHILEIMQKIPEAIATGGTVELTTTF